MAPRLAQPVPVGDLARILRVPIEGQADLPIDRLASLESADARSIGFLSSRKHLKAALDSSIGALVVSAELARQLPAHWARALNWAKTVLCMLQWSSTRAFASVTEH